MGREQFFVSDSFLGLLDSGNGNSLSVSEFDAVPNFDGDWVVPAGLGVVAVFMAMAAQEVAAAVSAAATPSDSLSTRELEDE
mmetsp:Transcript_9514/g.20549  ORF Transcript_9514/g.20549 Transcript_9514/m.20549 type:complete len:82 (-) Transcript_9514:159-404(-)